MLTWIAIVIESHIGGGYLSRGGHTCMKLEDFLVVRSLLITKFTGL